MTKALKIGTTAAAAITLAMDSGLTWDEAVAALGVACKALAKKASNRGDGSEADCESHALKRFNQGFEQDVDVLSRNLH